MKAILQYVQKVIGSGKDGTICINIDTGEVGTLTIKNRSIVAASLDGSSGKEALEALKLATIAHMEFWQGITQKADIQKLIRLQADTNELSPIPEDELHPEGAPLVENEDDSSGDGSIPDTDTLRTANKSKRAEIELDQLTEEILEALSAALTEYIGPAAGILVEGSIDQARDIDHLIELLADELFTDKDRSEFTHKAYFLLGQN